MSGAAPGRGLEPLRPGSGHYSRGQAYAVLVAMVLVTLCLDLAKLPMNVMVDPIRRSLGITDVQVSLLLGAVGAVPFVTMSLVGGWLSDRLSRRLLLSVAVVVWTLGAALCATAGSFEMLMLGRVVLFAGAGIKLPVAMTWVNDAFPPQQRGRAVGAFFVVLGAGPSLAIMLAGVVQRAAEGGAFAWGPAALGAEPWRLTTLLLALPGLLAVPLVLLLHSHRHHAAERPAGGPAPTTAGATMPLGLIATLVAVAALIVMVDSASLAWMPTVFRRSFGYDAQQAGFTFGVITLVAGSLGPLIGGWLGDALYRRHGLVGRVWLAAVACFCCVPLLSVYLVPAPMGLAVALTLNGVCTVAALSITYVNAQSLLPDRGRGLGTGVISAATSIVGSAGPTLVALSSEQLLAGQMALPRAIALVGGCGSLLAALGLLACARSLRAGISRPDAGSGSR